MGRMEKKRSIEEVGDVLYPWELSIIWHMSLSQRQPQTLFTPFPGVIATAQGNVLIENMRLSFV